MEKKYDENKVYYVYKHIRLDRDDSEKPFYVGKGCRSRHLSKSSRTGYWHNIVILHGYRTKIIEKGLTEKEAFDKEVELIAYYRELAFAEANFLDGGGEGWHHTEKTKEKLRQKHIGKKLSEQHKEKLSISHKGKKQSQETVEKRSAKLKGIPRSEDIKNKISKANTGKKQSLDRIEKTRQARLGTKHTEETKKKIGESQKGKFVSEETKIKTSISLGGKLFVVFNKEGTFLFEIINIAECARILNVDRASINHCLLGKYKSCKGYTFKYKEEVENEKSN
jgi:NUMOD3 motif